MYAAQEDRIIGAINRIGTISVGDITLEGGDASAANQVTGNNLLTTIAALFGQQRTPTITHVTGDGSVSAGARRLIFVLDDDFEGTILGQAFDPAVFPQIEIPTSANDTLAAVAYTVSAGGMLIFKTV